MTMDYKVKETNMRVSCRLISGEDVVCRCEVSANRGKFSIASWFTDSRYANQGYGKRTLGYTLQECVKRYGQPVSVEYIWNGTNPYVLDWLERHFDAVCTCPIAVLKTQSDDDWDSHIYRLDVAKVMEYFKLNEKVPPARCWKEVWYEG